MPSLTETGCRQRQTRLREALAEMNVDAVVITDYREVYYFTGALLNSGGIPVCLLMETAGDSWLISYAEDPVPTVGETLTYTWRELGTMSPDITRTLARAVQDRLSNTGGIGRLGWQSESLPRIIGEAVASAVSPAEWVAIDDLLVEMERRKDPDEVEAIRGAIAADLAAYDAVQKVIDPGVTELEVLAAGKRGAALAAGQVVDHEGDYRCGLENGPARNRAIQAGEMYIIDAGTYVEGYWSDLSRTFIVGAEPTDVQYSVYEHVASIQRHMGAWLKPGVRGTDVWRFIDARLREHPLLVDTGLTHHGGHAIGLRVHEMPDLNREREGILAAGDVVCVEPGGYAQEANYGARLENTYLITATGNVNLSDYPLSLVPQR